MDALPIFFHGTVAVSIWLQHRFTHCGSLRPYIMMTFEMAQGQMNTARAHTKFMNIFIFCHL